MDDGCLPVYSCFILFLKCDSAGKLFCALVPQFKVEDARCMEGVPRVWSSVCTLCWCPCPSPPIRGARLWTPHLCFCRRYSEVLKLPKENAQLLVIESSKSIRGGGASRSGPCPAQAGGRGGAAAASATRGRPRPGRAAHAGWNGGVGARPCGLPRGAPGRLPLQGRVGGAGV